MGNVRPKNSSDHPFLTPRQGAKAQQKRERNAPQNSQKGSKSQLKTNEASKNIVCQTCRQPFVSLFCSEQLVAIADTPQMSTTRGPAYVLQSSTAYTHSD